ncbi:tRNA synthetase subunit beta, partial [candidate division MSBL1 archaeon SCGC-AAA382A03]
MLEYSGDLKRKFPNLKVLTVRINNVKVGKKSDELEKFKDKIIRETREKYDLNDLKNVSVFRTYRDFFWKINIDPTKTRPASEALVRRVLQGKKLPIINTLVDAYNLASLKSGIPLAAFDCSTLEGSLEMRFARKGEKFRGIGMSKTMELAGGEIIITDSEKTIAIYPYRDSEETKITTETSDVLLMVCGVPGIEQKLEEA